MDKFATSAATVPEPCSVLGTSLRPFCLGHHLLLKRLELPFCGEPLNPAAWDQIQVGIAICGQEWNETREQLLTGQWQRVFARWQADLRGPWYSRRKPTVAALREAETLFRAYLADGYKTVPVWEDLGSHADISFSAPWELILKNTLIQNGHSESEVMRQYMPAAWYDYYAICEVNAAKACKDPAKWRKTFYTRDDWEREQALKEAGL